jgi:hypothetical protein
MGLTSSHGVERIDGGADVFRTDVIDGQALLWWWRLLSAARTVLLNCPFCSTQSALERQNIVQLLQGAINLPLVPNLSLKYFHPDFWK